MCLFPSQRCIKNCDKLESSVHWEPGEGNFTLSVSTTRSKNKRKKNVLGLLTMRSLMGIRRDDGTRKLVIIKFYDIAKGGRDILDQEISKWICKSVTHMGKKNHFSPYCVLSAAMLTIYTVQLGEPLGKISAFDIACDLAKLFI